MPAAAGDPFTAAFGNFAAGFGQSLGSGLTGGGGPFIGGGSAANSYGTTQDGSGWVVNVGGQQSATASPVRTSQANPTLYDTMPQYTGAPGGFAQAGVGAVAAVLLGLVALGMVFRKPKG